MKVYIRWCGDPEDYEQSLLSVHATRESAETAIRKYENEEGEFFQTSRNPVWRFAMTNSYITEEELLP